MKTQKPNSGAWQRDLRGSSPFLGVGLQLAGAVLIYVLAGWLLDRWLGTSPRWLLVGAGLGMVAFFVQLVRVVRQMNKHSKATKGKYKDLKETAWSDEDGWSEDEWDRDEWEERWGRDQESDSPSDTHPGDL